MIEDQECRLVLTLKCPGNEKEIKDWVFTFCGDHKHHKGYVVINGTWNDARMKMFKLFEDQWAFQYPSKDEAGVDTYRLKEINHAIK